jgi:hypothetical protein
MRCDCGKEKVVLSDHLMDGHTQSCGCLQKERARDNLLKHGKTGTRLFKVWAKMRGRCYNTNDKSYHNYGGRGISICDEWMDKENGFINFEKWALENGYDENAEHGECSIDRIDVNGNYEASNCRWADAKTQANNTRFNIKIEYDGRNWGVEELANKFGLSRQVLYKRLYVFNWPLEKALNTPKRLPSTLRTN